MSPAKRSDDVSRTIDHYTDTWIPQPKWSFIRSSSTLVPLGEAKLNADLHCPASITCQSVSEKLLRSPSPSDRSGQVHSISIACHLHDPTRNGSAFLSDRESEVYSGSAANCSRCLHRSTRRKCPEQKMLKLSPQVINYSIIDKGFESTTIRDHSHFAV